MSDLTILSFPQQRLRNKASRLSAVNDLERATLEKMAETMYLNNGVGLAAVQIGIDKQLAVIDIGDGLMKMVNPVIIKKEGVEVQEEGCLSVPGTVVKVKRAKKIVVNYMTEKGDAIQLKAEGLLARAIQHEVDHLSGKLIIDYLSPIKKLFLKRKI